MKNANKKPIRLEKTEIIHLRIADLGIEACIGAVHILAVVALPGTSINEKHIRDIFPAKRKPMLLYSYPVAILNLPASE